MPHASTTYYVDNVNGSDSNVGYDIDAPVRTVTRALVLCVAGNNDVIYIMATGTPIAETITMAKDYICLRGETPRVEITPAVTITADYVSLKTLTMSGVVLTSSLGSTIEDARIVDAVAYGIDIDAGCIDTHILEGVTYIGSVTGDIRDLGTDTYIASTAVDAGAIADAVWDETMADHLTAGSTGEKQNATATVDNAAIALAVEAQLLDDFAAVSSDIAGLNDFDAANDPVANVTLVATTTSNTDMRGTNSANTVVPPSTAAIRIEMDSNSTQLAGILLDTGTTIPAQISGLNNFDANNDPVAVVTLVNTTTTNTDMRGTDAAYTGTPPTVADIADQVWDEPMAGHVIVGSTGEGLAAADAVSDLSGFVDAVWDEALSTHQTAGSMGAQMTASTTVTTSTIENAVWDAAQVNHVGAASFGGMQGDHDSISAQITALNNFDPDADTVARVTLTDTTTTNTDMRGTDGANTVVPDAAGVAPTAAAIRAEIDSNSTQLATIVTDTTTDIPAQIAGLNDFDPATDTVANVTLVATTTTNTDMRGTDGANTVVPDAAGAVVAPTVVEIRTEMDSNSTRLSTIATDTTTDIPAQISALNNFDPATDTVANVTLVATTTTNTDKVTATEIEDAVWDAESDDHVLASSFGLELGNIHGGVDRSVHVNTELVPVGNGYQQTPYNNWSDAVDYAENNGLLTLELAGSSTVDRQLKNFQIRGLGNPVLNLNGQDMKNTNIERCTLTGSYLDTITVSECALANLQNMAGVFLTVSIAGTVTVANGADLIISRVGPALAAQPWTLDMDNGGVSTVAVHNITGGMNLVQMDHVSDVAHLHFSQGAITIDASCILGVVIISGFVTVTDNSSPGCTVTVLEPTNINSPADDIPTLSSAAVWDAATSSHTTTGSFGDQIGSKLLTLAKWIGLR